MTTCTAERPWGIHPTVRSDEACPRCGWIAPGPIGDAREAAEEARVWGIELGWTERQSDPGSALAA